MRRDVALGRRLRAEEAVVHVVRVRRPLSEKRSSRLIEVSIPRALVQSLTFANRQLFAHPNNNVFAFSNMHDQCQNICFCVILCKEYPDLDPEI